MDGPSAAEEEVGGSSDWGIVQDGNRGGQGQGSCVDCVRVDVVAEGWVEYGSTGSAGMGGGVYLVFIGSVLDTAVDDLRYGM
jgi:hypothetical protein